MPLDDATIGNLINGDENRRAIEAARALIHSRPCILFAGAGTSKPAGYPLWAELLTDLQAVLNDQGVGNVPAIVPADLLASADQLYACFGNNHLLDTHYYSFLCNHFAPKEGQSLELQQVLLTLPFCGIVTTNWDVCFEDAIHKARPHRPEFSPMFSIHEDHPNNVRRFFDSLWRGAEPNTVAHLHGVYNDAREIILTGTQYALAYGGGHEELTSVQAPRPSRVRSFLQKIMELMVGTRSGSHSASALFEPTRQSTAWTLLRRTVWALMATQRLVFVGFGMNDPFLYALLSYVSADLWDTTGQIHYFVTGVSKETNKDPDIDRRRLRNNLGVQSIFYEVQGHDHSRLVDVLYQLGATPEGGHGGNPPVSDLLSSP